MFNGERLKELREDNKMTQEEVAVRLGITQGSYAHFEKMRRQPSKKIVSQICKMFNVQEAYFYNEEIDKVRKLINDLTNQGIIQEASDVSGEVAELILETIKSEIRLNNLKKEQRV